MFGDNFNGFGMGGINGVGFDPLLLTWGLFQNSGHPGYYMMYKDLFDFDGSEEINRE